MNALINTTAISSNLDSNLDSATARKLHMAECVQRGLADLSEDERKARVGRNLNMLLEATGEVLASSDEALDTNALVKKMFGEMTAFSNAAWNRGGSRLKGAAYINTLRCSGRQQDAQRLDAALNKASRDTLLPKKGWNLVLSSLR